MPFKCGSCTEAFDSQIKRNQHVKETRHTTPDFEFSTCGRPCPSRVALRQHRKATGHRAPQQGATNVVAVQKTAVAEKSKILTTVKPEKPRDEPQICNAVDLDDQVAALHMHFLGLSPGQEQNEIDSSPLLLAPSLRESPYLQFGLLGGILLEDGLPSKESRVFYNTANLAVTDAAVYVEEGTQSERDFAVVSAKSTALQEDLTNHDPFRTSDDKHKKAIPCEPGEKHINPKNRLRQNNDVPGKSEVVL
ncbi:hypothetical protein CcaCcLH18_10947 [Colletotrichum camelliae]|nr:hypothetical protein CcaCcLH18_10947 [Colletotrichum camelliae]